MNKELNNMSRMEAVEAVASLFVQADALVVDLADASGYPDMMILVKDCMPLFVFVRPDEQVVGDWAAAKATVTKNLADVNATWFDVSELADLDWVLGEVLHRTKPGEIRKTVQITAEQAGFEIEPETPVEACGESVATPVARTVKAQRGGPIAAVEKSPEAKRKAFFS